MAVPANDTANSRINEAWQKFAIWACSAIIALLVIGFQDQKGKVDKLEEKVQLIYQDKVSKTELKDVEQRLMNRIEAGNADILGRLDLYFKSVNR